MDHLGPNTAENWFADQLIGLGGLVRGLFLARQLSTFSLSCQPRKKHNYNKNDKNNNDDLHRPYAKIVARDAVGSPIISTKSCPLKISYLITSSWLLILVDL